MPSPFPGMDPHLEHPARWPGVHMSLIAALQAALNDRLPPDLYAAIEQGMYVAEDPEGKLLGIPDSAVIALREPQSSPYKIHAERVGTGRRTGPPERGALEVELPVPPLARVAHLEVREAGAHQVVTVVELLSPTNKLRGDGRRQYEGKRLETLNSRVSFVEIDLLRAGRPMPVWRNGRPLPRRSRGDYRILVSRGHERPRARLYTFTVRDPIPVFRFPLRLEDTEAGVESEVDLRPLLDEVYERGRYQVRVNYRVEADPPLDAADAAWAEGLLQAVGRG
jgi:hypothetical protein